jgi:hypothetical protein
MLLADHPPEGYRSTLSPHPSIVFWREAPRARERESITIITPRESERKASERHAGGCLLHWFSWSLHCARNALERSCIFIFYAPGGSRALCCQGAFLRPISSLGILNYQSMRHKTPSGIWIADHPALGERNNHFSNKHTHNAVELWNLESLFKRNTRTFVDDRSLAAACRNWIIFMVFCIFSR